MVEETWRALVHSSSVEAPSLDFSVHVLHMFFYSYLEKPKEVYAGFFPLHFSWVEIIVESPPGQLSSLFLKCSLAMWEGDHRWHQTAWFGVNEISICRQSLQALGDASPSSLLISSFKKYRLSSGDIWDDLQTLEDARWESRFSFFLPSGHVVVIALNLRTKSMIPSALVVGKTEITSLSCRTILSSHREWQRAGSRFEPLVCTKRRRPLLSPLHCCLTGLHTAPATLQPVEECCVRHPQVSVLALPTRSRCVLRLVQTLALRGRSCCPDRQLAYQYKLGW